MNFIPKMDSEKLVDGYKSVLNAIYSPKQYYKRVETFLKQYKPQKKSGISRLELWHIWALTRSMWFLGVVDRGRWQYWKFLSSSLIKRPRSFPMSVTLAIWGFHFQKLARKYATVENE
jgi:hypothetical protein